MEIIVDEKKAELEECQKLQQMNETAMRDKTTADELVESLLAEERKLWQRENYKLQMENTELQNVILVKKNELEDCQKQLDMNREQKKKYAESNTNEELRMKGLRSRGRLPSERNGSNKEQEQDVKNEQNRRDGVSSNEKPNHEGEILKVKP